MQTYPILKVVALCRRCSVGPRCAIPSGHQNQVFQGYSLCRLHVPSCDWVASAEGMLVGKVSHQCVWLEVWSQLLLWTCWCVGLSLPSLGGALFLIEAAYWCGRAGTTLEACLPEWASWTGKVHRGMPGWYKCFQQGRWRVSDLASMSIRAAR